MEKKKHISGHERYQVKVFLDIYSIEDSTNISLSAFLVFGSESIFKPELDRQGEQGISASTHHVQECAAQSSVFTSR